MSYRILPCSESDIEYIYQRDSEEFASLAHVDGRIEEELLVFKAEDEKGGIIGGCVLSVDLTKCAEFNRLWVAERFRGRGIGAALIDAAERAAWSRGCQSIINAYCFDFQSARALFEKLGYTLIGTAKDWPKGHESYTLIKRFDDRYKQAESAELSALPQSDFGIELGSAEDGEFITAKLEEYNGAFAPRTHPYIDLDKKLVDGEGKIIAGCIAGVSGWDAAHIDLVWVDKACRDRDLCSRLLDEIEREARELGAHIARTNSCEAQSELFDGRGYSTVAVIEGEPKWRVMQKTLKSHIIQF